MKRSIGGCVGLKLMPGVLAVVCIAAPSLALADEGGTSGVFYRCDHASSEIRLDYVAASGDASEVPLNRDRTGAEWIAPQALVDYGAGEDGNARRVGQKSIVRHCGELELRISGGYYNTRVMGELGAADDYAIVEIIDAQKRSSGRLAMGPCNAEIARESIFVACPENWATSIVVLRDGADAFNMMLTQGHEETRPLLPATAYDSMESFTE